MMTATPLCHVSTCNRPGCSAEAGCQGHVTRERMPAEIEAEAQRLVDKATKWGLVLTIEQVPRKPLAMRNYVSTVSVRKVLDRT